MEGAGGGRTAAANTDGGETADRHGDAAYDRGGARALESRRGRRVHRDVKRAGALRGWPGRAARSHRPEGGSASDRHPHGTRPRSGLGSPKATRARAVQAAPALPRPALASAWPNPHPASRPRLRHRTRRHAFRDTTQPKGRPPLRQGAGGSRGWRGTPPRPRAMPPAEAVPPAPCGQRIAAAAASRTRARRSPRGPWPGAGAQPISNERRVRSSPRSGVPASSVRAYTTYPPYRRSTRRMAASPWASISSR